MEREPPDHQIAIVGAGFGGLGAAIALKRAGLDDFVILERAEDIGGTWRQNTYPDVAVDIPSFTYQFSFEKNPNWSRVFAKGAEVKAYIDHCADKYGLRPHIRLNTEMRSRTWDEEAGLWRIETAAGSLSARYVITALGAFIDPKEPEIPGLDAFAGKVIRSQEWDHAHDFSGERVAVIGTGASAVQLIPPVAREAGHLTVYQRRPIYCAAKPDYVIPEWAKRIFRAAPPAQAAVRYIAAAFVEIGLVGITVYGRRLPFTSRIPARVCNAYMRSQIKDPELRRKLTPDYAFGCKRPAMSNLYFKAFTRPDVELVTEPIERITARGVVTAGGAERELDTLVLATGFRLSHDPENYRRVPVRGRDGFDLADFYEREPLQAYEGVSLPQLPNSFSIFGPYSWTGSSWHQMVEMQSHHAIRVIREAARRGARVVSVRPEANERFLAFARRRLRNSILYAGGCGTANTYYYDHHGELSLLRPTTALEAWVASRRFDLDDYAYV